MAKRDPSTDPRLLDAFNSYEREERIRNTKIGCFLVVVLMPVGTSLDYFVYPDHLWPFFQLRVGCSILAAVIWRFLYTELGKKWCRWLSVVVALLPVLFIAKMIADTEGLESPYYAGLNLVLLAVGAVLHWTTMESIIAVVSVLLIYCFVGFWHGLTKPTGIVFNNFYFVVLMDIIVVVGTYVKQCQTFREFALRFELDQSRQKLEESNRKLIELDQVKNRFFANVSHELRTPLTLILAPLETLIRQHGIGMDAEMRQLLLIMQGNGMRLLKLINDLLDLVRLQSGRMEIRQEPVTIQAVLRGLSSAIGKTAEDRGIRLEISCDETIGTVLTDRDKLERILLNLLFNALKFTPAGGSVRVSARRENGDLRLVVLDNGVGITDEDLPFIFDRFWQADTSAKRQYRGVGLGLALVKELVEAQGGTVAVTSKIGNGSQFTVSLPYHDFKPPSLVEQAENVVEPDSTVRSADAPEGAETSGQNLKRQAEFYPSIIPLRETIRSVETSIDNKAPRVLIADDEPDMLDFLKRQFSTEFQVIEAIDGQQAIDKAMQFLPDVIVCDMMMPQKDGLEVCRDLRQRTSTQTIPILLLTARADDETKLTVLSAGANDFVSKPFSTTELRVRLKNLLESYRLQQELSRKNQILEATLEQLKETEAQLVQSEKLVSLGRMSAGLIHEINNPLNFAKTALYVLRTMAKPRAENEKTELQETLRDVEEGITRVINIVSDLRTFTQPNLTQFEKIPVEEVISSALRLLSNQWQNRVRVEKEIANDQTIRGNRNLITHVLLNLLQNALYALERKTCCETVATIWIRSFRQNGEDVIVVRDNGEGIGPEDLNKVFDPFFTTKDVGDGMGLGLSICYRIMKQHGGRVQVQSERGRYSEFTLYFPHTATSSGAA